LLYLVVEELLVQAHKMPETKTATVLFFIGFFCVIFMENLFETFPIHTPTQGAE
jgi:ZIP family zinc transporter